MNEFIEITNNFNNLGIVSRKITEGEEFDLVKQFITYKKETFKSSETNKLAIFVETKINNSYPDIVFVEFNPYNYDNWAKSRNEISASDLKIVYHLISSGPSDASTIVSLLGVPWKELLLSIEKLYDSRLIIRKNNSWQISNFGMFNLNKLIAVEAKINKFNEVIQQAIINKTFASESYVLSKTISSKKKKLIEESKTFGVGVYLRENLDFLKIKESSESKFPVNYNSLFYNEWIGRVLNN